jgi:hypothetical protein
MERGQIARAAIAVILAVGAPGCGETTKSDPAAVPPSGKPVPPTEPPTAITATPIVPPAPTPELVSAEVEQLVDRWRYQREWDFSRYADLYHPRRFTGVRRTPDGEATELDTARWLAERKRMAARNPDVVVEALVIHTWLDGPALAPQTSTAEFVQKWRTTEGTYYADHGRKRLTLWRDPSGRQWIVREELLDSEPGWDEWDLYYHADLKTAVEALQRGGQVAAAIARDLVQRLVDHPDCAIAMTASVELARRGDATRLPRRPRSDVLADHARALCLLSNDPDDDRRRKTLRTFLAPIGPIELIRRDCSAGDGSNPRLVFLRTAAAADIRDRNLDEVFETASAVDCDNPLPNEMRCRGRSFQPLEFTLTTLTGLGIYVRRLASEAQGSCGD